MVCCVVLQRILINTSLLEEKAAACDVLYQYALVSEFGCFFISWLDSVWFDLSFDLGLYDVNEKLLWCLVS